MKKICNIFLFWMMLCSACLAESYYFKECKLSNAVSANYIINIDKNIIEVNLRSLDGATQSFKDKIKTIEQNKIISEKIESKKGESIYYQYFLNSKTNTVIKMEYKKESGIEMEVFKPKLKRESYCANVKGGWDKNKIEAIKTNKKEEQILKAQEEIKNEQSSLPNCPNGNHKQWTKCKGLYQAETGHKYNGLFENGEITKGISIYPGGAKYVGEFKNYKPHGYGTFVWTNGDKYYGEWKSGKSNGNGTKIWKNGRKYLGKFKNDKLHGLGTLFYPDGKKYTGEFINGKRHGEGTFTYTDGTAYIGKFIAGQEEGVGECIGKDGSSVVCKGRAETQEKDFTGKDTRNISITAKKWVRISQYENKSKKGKKVMDKLKTDFDVKALEICGTKDKYNILEKKIEVLDIDETPAYGLETKVKLGINGVVECI